MTELPPLIVDLFHMLLVAAPVTIFFKKIKQPVVLGYLLSGMIIGPYFEFFPNVKDTEGIKTWAEMGMIFLLFGVGLEFNIRRLMDVGRSVTTIAMVEVPIMFSLGYVIAYLIGWGQMDRIFMGAMIAISSTTIIAKAFEELGLKSRKFVHLVFGVLVIEDIIAILLLVLLSTFSVTQLFSGSDLAFLLFKITLFMVSWFVGGIYIVPTLVNKIKKTLNDETILIFSIGLCLLMVVWAKSVGFSPALGAFVMGSVFAETTVIKHIEHVFKSVKSIFSAIFFISVGMLINPGVILDNYGVVAIFVLTIICGKFIGATFGTLLAGENLKNSTQVGLSLTQIGEFSFIIATLGVTHKVISDTLYPIAVAASAVTTFTTPYFIKNSDLIFEWFEKKLPPRFVIAAEKYHLARKHAANESLFKIFIKSYGLKIFINSLVIMVIGIVAKKYLLMAIAKVSDEIYWSHLFATILAILVAMPFFWPILFAKPHSFPEGEKIPVRSFEIMFSSLKFLITLLLLAFLVGSFFHLGSKEGMILMAGSLLTLSFLRHFGPLYQFLEDRFLLNLSQHNHHEEESPLEPWEHILVIQSLSPYSELNYKKVKDTKIKEMFGVTIALIQRGEVRIIAPEGEEVLYPNDRIYLLGEENKLEELRNIVEVPYKAPVTTRHAFSSLEIVTLEAGSPFVGKMLKDCGFREKLNGLVVGVEKSGKRLVSPPATLVLEVGDRLWIVGDRKLIKAAFSTN